MRQIDQIFGGGYRALGAVIDFHVWRGAMLALHLMRSTGIDIWCLTLNF